MGIYPKRPITAFFALALLGALSLGAEWTSMTHMLDKKGFEKVETKHGITVYRHPSKVVVRLAAEGEFAHPPEKVQQVLLDYPGQIGRIRRLTDARVLESKYRRLLVYQRINLPVISDRDFNLEVRWGQTDELRWIRFNAVSQTGLEVQSRVVRVVNHAGSWQLTPIKGGNATLARFQFRIDLGGNIPTWLARSSASDDVAEVFLVARKMLAER